MITDAGNDDDEKRNHDLAHILIYVCIHERTVPSSCALEEEEEEGLFKADAVNEEDPERDRATPA